MYYAIITWQNNNTRQTQYSLQQSTKAPNTFPSPESKTPTMANEPWNVDSLEIPSTIVAAADPSPSNTTFLSNEHAALEATHVTRASAFNKILSQHSKLDREVVEIEASLAQEQKALEKLSAQTKDLLANTKSEEKELARIDKKTNILVDRAAPIRVEIDAIATQLVKKDTEAK
jgi:septal ring factor EnvC (AmiA/AmiB activator)